MWLCCLFVGLELVLKVLIIAVVRYLIEVLSFGLLQMHSGHFALTGFDISPHYPTEKLMFLYLVDS